jgi:hypothetical protein
MAEPSGRVLSSEEVRRLRLRAQHLAEPASREALVDVVRDLVGVQAQMPQAAALSLRARVAGLTREDLREALEVQRTLVRTWVMRGTIHLVRTEDVRWMLPALPTSVLRQVPRWLERRAGLELQEASLLARKVERFLLRRGPMTRSEIVDAVGLAPEAAYGLMRLAGLDGRICYGPDRGSDQTFVAVREWLPELPPLAAPEPGELARRYLAGYGPAEPADLGMWWGLPLGRARTELTAPGGEAHEVTHDDRTLTVLAEHLEGIAGSPASPVRLVGAWDTYILGHTDRSLILDPQHARKVNRGGGWLHPVVLVDGRVAGIWRAERRSRRLDLSVEAFTPLSSRARDGIREEAEDVARFLDVPVDLQIRRRR